MSNDNKDNLKEALDQYHELYQSWSDDYSKESEAFWQNLTEEQRLYAFYSVCKRIYQGDMVEQRSYRGVLYDTFGFGAEAYMIGMECGYMEIHNAIYATPFANNTDPNLSEGDE